jgi:uncharacterized protein YaiE (UPF0345 family)
MKHSTYFDGNVQSLEVHTPEGRGWENVQKGNDLVVPRDVSFEIEAKADVAYICYYR